MNWEDLIAASRLLIQDTDCSEAAVRRAVSTAYYAVFHALAESNADALTRIAQVPVLDETWSRYYRAIQHHETSNRFRRTTIAAAPTAVADFMDLFIKLQTVREQADYNPDSTAFTRDFAAQWIDRAETIIQAFVDLDDWAKIDVAAVALFDQRRAPDQIPEP